MENAAVKVLTMSQRPGRRPPNIKAMRRCRSRFACVQTPSSSSRKRNSPMKALHWRSILLLIVIGSMSSFAQNKPDNAKRQSELKKPLVIASQGSFFIGGESKALPSVPGRGGFGGGGDVTINQ